MSDVPPSPTPLRLAFARGMAPSRWAERWAQVSGVPLELVPVNIAYGRNDRVESDVTLERVLPSELPAGNAEPGRTRHAIQLYTEKLSLVVARDHEFAEQDAVSLDDLATVALLDHPLHPAEWPAPQPWADPSWMPTTLRAALQLVATGSGGIILPTMLARHLSDKREHALLTITDADALPSTTVWATWDVARDAADVQELVGVLRGRTARSSRANTDVEAAPKPAKRVTKQPTKSAKSGPKPGSRGAQLAATRKKPPHRGRR
ncbi:transcriptional regulator, LysR family, putative [Leucobacter sp. 7(1)]|uniref:LysR substrate-binding domain-containing protein n=1 Tax=Leucobacter sp. 7(1) TaxID=1255613 RepID=UPI00097EDA7F|nr:LysR substrate-binding domain-containing protein [Leucobacter sp. 7(1)]SJN09835.1 transcriptional regulator, LysR family, putative [Leucobacter sp. 7(1)]